MDSLHAAAEAFASLETQLNPGVWGNPDHRAAVHAGLQAGRIVLLRNALPVALADNVHQCLDAATNWREMSSYDSPDLRLGSDAFNFRHSNIYSPADDQSALHICRQLFTSRATAAFIARISGLTCEGPTTFSAAWYRAWDHSTPHRDDVDEADGVRRVAYIWYLARDWDPRWGGALYSCAARRYLPPQFNTLALFRVGTGMEHCVTPVSPHAGSKRLSVNGWFRDLPRAAQPQIPDVLAGADDVVEIS